MFCEVKFREVRDCSLCRCCASATPVSLLLHIKHWLLQEPCAKVALQGLSDVLNPGSKPELKSPAGTMQLFFFLQKFLGTFTIPPILLWQYYSSSLLFLVLFSKSIIILLPSLLSIVPYSVITKLAIVALKFILVFKLQERTLAIFVSLSGAYTIKDPKRDFIIYLGTENW